MAPYPFRRDLSLLEEHYSRLLREHGDTPEGVQWSDRQSQERRMAILTEVGDLRSARVLDFGCGTGHLLAFMRDCLGFTGDYVGYDLSVGMIATAQGKFPGIRFEQRDVLAEGVPEEFDFVLVNGVFNNRVHNNWNLMRAILQCLFSHTRNALAFNALSTYVDFCDPKLFYINPEEVFRFCKEQLSPCVMLRHDYLIKPGIVPFEFSVYLYKTEVQPRKGLSI